MKVFITGSSGLLATNTIFKLIENGYAVKALIRNKHNCIVPACSELELVEGDVTDFRLLESAVQGCDYIIHAAAETRQGLINYQGYNAINVEGTGNVFTAAIKHGVNRVIYVSTANVFGFGSILHPGDERTEIKEPFSNSLYTKSKLEGQHVALSFNDTIEVIIVNPTFMIGPYDQKPGSGRIITRAFNKKLIFYPPGGKNFVHVSDVATGIVSALTNGKNGELYLFANENLSYREFYEKLSKHSPSKPLLIKIPKFVLFFLGVIGNILKLLGVNNEFIMNNMQIISVKNFYSGKKAEYELNIKFKSVDSAIKDFLEWYYHKRSLYNQ